MTQAQAARTYSGPFARLPFRGDRLSLVAALVLASLAIVGLLGPALPLGDPNAIGLGPRLAPPGPHWLFGTDALGRSALPRVIEGIRATLVLSTVSVLLTVVVGTAVGMVAAYVKGPIDELTVRIADVLFSFPAILMAIMISAIIGPGQPGAIVAIVLITLPLMVRVVRAATVLVADRDFVVSSEVAGGSFPRIVLTHLLPNVAGAAVVQATYAISVGMLVESTLSFLGLGVQPPNASLGSILHEGIVYLSIAPWLVFVPGLVLAAAILAVNLLGDGLRDTLDPRETRLLR